MKTPKFQELSEIIRNEFRFVFVLDDHTFDIKHSEVYAVETAETEAIFLKHEYTNQGEVVTVYISEACLAINGSIQRGNVIKTI